MCPDSVTRLLFVRCEFSYDLGNLQISNHVQQLTMRDCKLKLHHLAQVRFPKALKALDLSDNVLDKPYTPFQVVMNTLLPKSLKKLNLSMNGLSLSATHVLWQLPPLLETCDLSDNCLNNSCFSKINVTNNLKQLDIRHNFIRTDPIKLLKNSHPALKIIW